MTIEVVEFFQSLQNGFFDLFFNFISFLGEQYIYIFIIAVVYYAYDKKLGELLSLSLFFASVLNNVIKGIVSAKRPFEKFPDRVNNLRPSTSTGHSFPSGHTQGFATFLYAEAFWTRKKNIFIVATILSVLMAMSRMYLGVHFLEDVLVSIVLGIISAWLLVKLFNNIKDDDFKLHTIYVTMLIVFLPFLWLLDGADLFKSYGLLAGFTGAMMFEKQYVKFSLQVSVQKKVIRVVSGLITMLSIQLGLGFIFDLIANEGTQLLNILDMIRYGLIAFVGLGVYPLLFKKFNF